MEQYLPKAAVVAEIESRIKSMEECFNGKFPMSQSVKETEQDKGKLVAYKSILSFINTIEVKEANLEKELIEWHKEHFKKDGTYIKKSGCYLTNNSQLELVKHFFELGLKTQHSSIGIPNIDDIFEEEGIDPNSKDAKIFKECYYMALEKLKAQK